MDYLDFLGGLLFGMLLFALIGFIGDSIEQVFMPMIRKARANKEEKWMKRKIVIVRRYFQMVRALFFVNKGGCEVPVITKFKLKQIVPIGHKVYLEINKYKICTKVIDLTAVFADTVNLINNLEDFDKFYPNERDEFNYGIQEDKDE